MFCTNCGKDNGDHNRFCIECGTPLKTKEELQNINDAPAPQNDTFASPSKTLNVFSSNSSSSNNTLGDDSSTTILSETRTIVLRTDDGSEYRIDSLPSVVGKGSKADTIISGDETISRQHFCIHDYEGNGFVIEDLGSTNKTFLNGNVIESDELVVLNNGDTIKAGQTSFKVEI